MEETVFDAFNDLVKEKMKSFGGFVGNHTAAGCRRLGSGVGQNENGVKYQKSNSIDKIRRTICIERTERKIQ